LIILTHTIKELTAFKWIGFIAVSKIEGSYANVMGLPVDKVYDYLNKLD
jgi:predicted house-cleaning NTP pyrophosphatase (Maf/HAM1 superfamily)